ncbi:MAG: glutamyl-tRNA reductase [Pyrinomonadaceae bacterium]|jgi:glutamyl-tRNA reductase|nr:glutamyl-tRNA reductase [Pyrinomonadaceae bacterium]
MSIVLVGVNHKSTPLAVRELLALSDDACATGLRSLVDGEIVREGLIVSTCNRVEVLTETAAGRLNESTERIIEFLTRANDLPRSQFEKELYQHTDDQAVRHLFRVASSLDSMVVGEPQVLGQVRRAYSIALEAGTTGRILNRLVHHAFRVAKRVRTETGIAANAVSISYMAVELGKKIFDSFAGRTALLIGAGEMAELAARHLINAGVSNVLLANRSEEPARALATELGGTPVPFNRLTEHLSRADIVICSTAADDYIVTERMMRAASATRRNRPVFFIDISVPRNIDPAVGKIPNVFVFDIDDLESVVSSNIREREREAQRAELIVESEIMQFQQALRALESGPAIGALKQMFQDIARHELKRQRNRLGPLSPEQEASIEALLLSTVNKLSHPMLSQMRHSSDASDAEIIEAWRDIFDLED